MPTDISIQLGLSDCLVLSKILRKTVDRLCHNHPRHIVISYVKTVMQIEQPEPTPPLTSAVGTYVHFKWFI